MNLPPNVIIDESEQGSHEWHQARLGRATASKAGDVVKTLRSGTPAQARLDYAVELALERITCERADFITTMHMQRGTELEPTARLEYEFQTSNIVNSTGFWYFDDFMAGASPDGLVGDDGLIEIKIPKSATHLNTLTTNEIPEYYEWQIQQQLWVTDRQWCDYVSFDNRFPANARLFIKRVPRNSAMIDKLKTEVTKLLKEVEQIEKQIREYGL